MYPPEKVERKRFQKIAKALGTRTTQQARGEGRGGGGGGGGEGMGWESAHGSQFDHRKKRFI